MNTQIIKNLVAGGEGISVEFKTCRNKLNRDVYETVCAFLNRHGGTILLGVDDNRALTGIAPDAVAQIKKDFVTAINNSQKINPVCYLSVNEELVDGKIVLCRFMCRKVRRFIVAIIESLIETRTGIWTSLIIPGWWQSYTIVSR